MANTGITKDQYIAMRMNGMSENDIKKNYSKADGSSWGNRPTGNINPNDYSGAENTGTLAGSQAVIGDIINGSLGGQSDATGISGLGGFASYINGQDYNVNNGPSVSDILSNPELHSQYDDLYDQYTAATDPNAPATTANRGGFIDYKTAQGRKDILDYIYDLVDNNSLTSDELDEVVGFLFENSGKDLDSFSNELSEYELGRAAKNLEENGLTRSEDSEDLATVINNSASDIAYKLSHKGYTVEQAYKEIADLAYKYDLSDSDLELFYNAINQGLPDGYELKYEEPVYDKSQIIAKAQAGIESEIARITDETIAYYQAMYPDINPNVLQEFVDQAIANAENDPTSELAKYRSIVDEANAVPDISDDEKQYNSQVYINAADKYGDAIYNDEGIDFVNPVTGENENIPTSMALLYLEEYLHETGNDKYYKDASMVIDQFMTDKGFLQYLADSKPDWSANVTPDTTGSQLLELTAQALGEEAEPTSEPDTGKKSKTPAFVIKNGADSYASTKGVSKTYNPDKYWELYNEYILSYFPDRTDLLH